MTITTHTLFTMTSIATHTQEQSTENKLFIENYKILQSAPEATEETSLTYNYHTVDIVTNKLSTMSLKEMLFALNIDRSGSMGALASDGYSSLQHTIHTTKNIIDYLEELKEENPEIEVGVIVNAFDGEMKTIGYLKIGNNKEKQEYIKNLEKLTPRGSTNISDAFQAIKEDEIYKSTPDDKKAHILMTDGRPNIGKNSANGILESNPGGTQICIGYGTDHDAKLLQNIAEKSNGDYHFVDSIENAGMVYGEVIHSLLYCAVKDIKIQVTGAEVYDFTKNIWTSSVGFSSFASEHTQSLILRSGWDSVHTVSVNIVYTESGNKVKHSKTDVFNSYNCTNGEAKTDERDTHVEKQMFRQRTMDGLFRAKNVEYIDRQSLKKELIILENEIKAFMKTNNLEDDAFMQKLVADVYVAYNGMDSHCGVAFIGSRLTSQGNQRAYEVNNLEALSNATTAIFGSVRCGPESMRRSSAPSLNQGQSQRQESFTMRAPQNLRQASCYTTPTQAAVMRVCSQQPDTNDN